MIIRERYTPRPIAANTTITLTGDSVGGFLCKTAGTLSIVRNNDDGTTTTIVDAIAVSASVYYPIPFYLGKNGGTATTAGGAVGTLGV